MKRLLAPLLLCLMPALAGAECRGANLFAALPPADQAAIRTATDAAPFAQGLLWQAIRGDEKITLLGTYHFADPRHDAIIARITPLIDAATTLLVEAGPDEEAALKRDLARDPSLIVAPSGPTLPESLTADEWAALSDAMQARGMPPFMVAKLRPWYVTMLLALPPCAATDQAQLAANGLDQRVIDRAKAQALPVRGLEPHDTVLRLFGAMSSAEQIGLIRQALATEPQAEDLSATLADSYFAEDARLIWELSRFLALQNPDYTPEQVARDFAQMEDLMMTTRNRSWIPVLEQAAASGPVFAAFGALHLSGETGVLALLEQAGFSLERLPL